LVELVVVIAIMAILIGVSVPVFTSYIEKSEIATDKSNVGELVRNIEVAGKTHAFKIDDVAQVSSDGLQVPVGFIVLSNDKILDKNSVDQGYVYVMSPSGDNVLEKILVGTYGNDYDNMLRLVSDTWTESNIPTLYAEADDLFGTVKKLSDLLYVAKDVTWPVNIKDRLDKTANYQNSVDMVHKVAIKTLSKISLEDFQTAWKNAPLSNNQKYAFGLDGTTTEVYTGARRAYNEAIAAYILKNSSHTDVEKHAEAIVACGEGVESLGLILSDTFNIGAIKNDEKGSNFLGGKKGSLPDSVQNCTECEKWCKNYNTSKDATNDARAYYQVMQTLASDSPEVLAAIESGSWDVFQNYINNFSALYGDLQTVSNNLIANGQSCVVVTVYCDPATGELYSEVSPNSILEDS
jgi:hypothetical protein